MDSEKKVGLSTVPTSSNNSGDDVHVGSAAQYGETQRGLSPRHVQLMAIGGSIGTGLWVCSLPPFYRDRSRKPWENQSLTRRFLCAWLQVGIGGTLSAAGPLSLILGYTFWGLLFIWPLNLCVAEMCAYLPIRGSIFELAARFFDPALGFAMGWTYFFAGLMLVCTEYSAVATVMQYWVPDVNPAAWIAMTLVICFLLNVVAVK